MYLFLKKIVFFLVILLTSAHLPAQNKIEATINNFENNKGLCRACLFNSAASFEKSDPFLCLQVNVIGRTARVVFDNVPDGTYAIFVFHDANNNNKMDKSWLGIPSEGYGASKNKLPFAAAPKFDANKFFLSNNLNLKLNIRLRNL